MGGADITIGASVVLAIISGLFGVSWWFFRGEMTRQAECLRHLEENQKADAANLEQWKLLYVERHAQLTAQVKSIQDVQTSQQSMALQIAILSTKLDDIARRLSRLERGISFLGKVPGFGDEEAKD